MERHSCNSEHSRFFDSDVICVKQWPMFADCAILWFSRLSKNNCGCVTLLPSVASLMGCILSLYTIL